MERQEAELEHQKNSLIEMLNQQPEDNSELRDALQVEIDRQQAVIDEFREKKEGRL